LYLSGEGLNQFALRLLAYEVEGPRYSEHTFEFGTERGVASLATTAAKYGPKLIVIDPLGEFDDVDPTSESTLSFIRAANAVAKALGVAILVGMHTNADGIERGTKHFRQFAETMVSVESLPGDRIGFVMDKQRNGPRRAATFFLAPAGPGAATVVPIMERGFPEEDFTSADYRKEVDESRGAARSAKAERSLVAEAPKLLEFFTPAAPLKKREVRALAKEAWGWGDLKTDKRLDYLVESGELVVEEGRRNSLLYSLASDHE
jgi:hypothetical protein